jgi:hypothetical protein
MVGIEDENYEDRQKGQSNQRDEVGPSGPTCITDF